MTDTHFTTSGSSPGRKRKDSPRSNPARLSVEFCETRKKSFPSMESAQAYADYLREKYGTVSTPYACDLCGAFHNSTMPQIQRACPLKFTLGDRARMRNR